MLIGSRKRFKILKTAISLIINGASIAREQALLFRRAKRASRERVAACLSSVTNFDSFAPSLRQMRRLGRELTACSIFTVLDVAIFAFLSYESLYDGVWQIR